MAITDVIDETQSTTLIAQLGPFLAAFEPGHGVDPGAGLAESLQVWTVSLADFQKSGAGDATWSQVWHHQLRTPGGPADGYARSLDHGEDRMEMRAVVRSPVATDIDDALTALDHDPQFREAAIRVRLLAIVDVQFEALWIAGPGEANRYIPLGRFARPGEQRLQPMSEKELQDMLSGRRAIGIDDSTGKSVRPGG